MLRRSHGGGFFIPCTNIMSVKRGIKLILSATFNDHMYRTKCWTQHYCNLMDFMSYLLVNLLTFQVSIERKCDICDISVLNNLTLTLSKRISATYYMEPNILELHNGHLSMIHWEWCTFQWKVSTPSLLSHGNDHNWPYLPGWNIDCDSCSCHVRDHLRLPARR